jgi:ribosomal protein S18 acetylase RimI-like enzyme
VTCTPRPARPDDDAALVRLAADCPMPGALTLCNERAPRFFALTELESLGHAGPGRIWVSDDDAGVPIGCLAWAERLLYLDGNPTRVGYVSDLKVHPNHRGRGVADALVRAVRDDARAVGGAEMPGVLTVLAGNQRVERRLPGPRDQPRVERFAELEVLSIPLLPWRRSRDAALDVRPADATDADQMLALWRSVAPGRQLAPVLDGGRFERFLAAAPDLSLASYWLARRRADGRLLGFLALWDQARFKQTVVRRWGARLAAFRWAWNAFAAIAPGWARLPAAGQPLRHLTAFHTCVPADRPDVLRALVLAGSRALRGRGYAFVNVALDRRDPLRAGLRGLGGQPTRVAAGITTPAGGYHGPPLDNRPLHFETALV